MIAINPMVHVDHVVHLLPCSLFEFSEFTTTTLFGGQQTQTVSAKKNTAPLGCRCLRLLRQHVISSQLNQSPEWNLAISMFFAADILLILMSLKSRPSTSL